MEVFLLRLGVGTILSIVLGVICGAYTGWSEGDVDEGGEEMRNAWDALVWALANNQGFFNVILWLSLVGIYLLLDYAWLHWAFT